MNGVLGHLCAHLGKTETGAPPGDDEMTLPSGHRTRNLCPGSLRPSTLLLGHGGSHNIESLRVSGLKFVLQDTKIRSPAEIEAKILKINSFLKPPF